MPDWFTLGAGALGALGSIAGGAMSAAGADRMNQQNIQFQQNMNDQNYARQWYENRRAEDFYFDNQQYQTYMSNTAYQRATADMRAAGLNPILAYKQGGAGGGSVASPSGQSAGAGTAPRVENTQGDLGRGIGRAVSSATDALTAVGTLENLKEQNQLLKEQTSSTAATTANTTADTAKKMSETRNIDELFKQFPFMRDLLTAQTAAASAAAGASGASAAQSTESARAIREDADRKRDTGDSIPGGIINTIERLIRRAANAQGGLGRPASTNPVPGADWMQRNFPLGKWLGK